MAELPPYLLKQLHENDRTFGPDGSMPYSEMLEAYVYRQEKKLQAERAELRLAMGGLALAAPDSTPAAAIEQPAPKPIPAIYKQYEPEAMRDFLLQVGDQYLQRDTALPSQPIGAALLEHMFGLVDMHQDMAQQDEAMPTHLTFEQLTHEARELESMAPSFAYGQEHVGYIEQSFAELNASFSEVANDRGSAGPADGSPGPA